MDRTDRAILAVLQEDARMSNVELAGRVGLSPSACLRRVAALETGDGPRGPAASRRRTEPRLDPLPRTR